MAEIVALDGIHGTWCNELANRWFQPLTHVSAHGRPRDWPETCQRRIRETRKRHRLASLHRVQQYVPPMNLKNRATNPRQRMIALTETMIGASHGCH